MNSNCERPWKSAWGGLVLACITLALAPKANANVYASNLRINGGLTNLVANAGDPIQISYVLNEPATLGVTIQARVGAAVVQTVQIPAGLEGTLRGFNTVTWDSSNLPSGNYSFSLTAASSGYTNWTQITSDTQDLNTYVFDGRGIAVDRNPTSPYYGRIFVANSSLGLSPSTTPGDTVGILKFNADTTGADEGISSAGLDGHLWSDQSISPWKVEVSADDFVYVNDLANNGDIYRWDPTLSSNAMVHVLRQDNQPPGSVLSGPAIAGTGTNTQVWMVDTNTATVVKWSVTPDLVCASNDTGNLVVVGSASNLFDVALDPSGNVYACAFVGGSGDPSPRVFRYPAYNPSTNNNMPEATATWAVGAGNDSYAGASGLAVDPTGTYLAVAFRGPDGGVSTNGNTKILWATNGALAANLDLGVAMQGDANHDDTDCAWDAVGNVYYIDVWFGVWRAFSPPGTNQATTVCLPTIQLTGAPPPTGTIQITGITVSGGNVNVDFSAGTNDSPGSFSVQGASVVTGPYANITGASVAQVGPGQFRATFPLGPNTQYLRIAGSGTTPPPSQLAFTQVSASGGKMLLTFSGSATDTPGSFTLLSTAAVNAAYAPDATATISQLSPGIFQASVPINGSARFYRVRR